MSTVAQDTPLDAAEAPSAAARKTRPFLWSVRRELWENRSIFVAPAITAAIVLLGMLVGAVNVPRHVVISGVTTLNSSDREMAVQIPFYFATAIILVASFVVGFFYCLGALYGERRDRTILFWKSLPVSDLTAVLAKATVALVVLPLVTYVVILVTHLVLLLASTLILPANGLPAMLFWQQVPLLRTWGVLLVVLACLSLWNAPIWGWLFLVSGWARRVTFLWAVGPPIALDIFERLAFHTHYVGELINYRIQGGLGELFDTKLDTRGQMTIDPDHLDLARFFSTPGLWIGLVAAAALFAVVVWQRRYRSPL
jgi:ABC-2 type transport system permease protein